MSFDYKAKKEAIEAAVIKIKPFLKEMFGDVAEPEVQIMNGTPSGPKSYIVRGNGLVNLYPEVLPAYVFELNSYKYILSLMAHALTMGHYVKPTDSYKAMGGLVITGLSDAVSVYAMKYISNNDVGMAEVSDMLGYMANEVAQRYGTATISAMENMLRYKGKATRNSEEFLARAEIEINKLMDNAKLREKFLSIEGSKEGLDDDYFTYNIISRYGKLFILPAMKRHFVLKEIKFNPREFGIFVKNIEENPRSLFNLLRGTSFYLTLIAGHIKEHIENSANANGN